LPVCLSLHFVPSALPASLCIGRNYLSVSAGHTCVCLSAPPSVCPCLASMMLSDCPLYATGVSVAKQVLLLQWLSLVQPLSKHDGWHFNKTSHAKWIKHSFI
jgi:hypothetical protein